MKCRSPAAARNREPIAAVLRDELPARGLVLEVASGTGEHAVHFARVFPALTWQPSDCDPEALASIAAWREAEIATGAADNLLPPIRLDVSKGDWPERPVAAILSINLVHISPPRAAEALFEGAGRLLASGAPLVLYGPFLEQATATAASNIAFDASLRAREPSWGLRDIAWLDRLGTESGLARTRRIAMPANNLMLVYRRDG